MGVEIRLLQQDDTDVLQDVDPDVFDSAVDQHLAAQFLADSRHHIIVVIDDGRVVGMITAVGVPEDFVLYSFDLAQPRR